MPPLIAICILNWNSPQKTIECVKSVIAKTSCTIDLRVLDNGSDRDSVNFLEEEISRLGQPYHEEMQLIPSSIIKLRKVVRVRQNLRIFLWTSEKNLGFSGGINALTTSTSGQNQATHFLFLNNDATLGNDVPKLLLDAMTTAEMSGIAGATNWSLETGHFVEGGQTYNKKMKRTMVSHEPNRIFDVDKVIGASLLISRECLQSVGGLNVDYYLYYEDDELCLKAKQKGFRVLYVTDAKILHSTAGTSNKYIRRYYLERNKFLFIRRNSPNIHMASNLARCYFDSIRHLVSLIIRHKRYDDALVQGWAILDSTLGRFGRQRFDRLVSLSENKLTRLK